ncbi:hypothetical protein DFA_08587 [Cavenderia fasciculata]|uniref:RIC1 C-terminal alpha solenoid region domain-containing protein n=1 Tax=Cavenderia fasciculata TaxID=261658 RepID=F4Q381_CACFS|nr:uncharacterized protein DFA_08587 [Cavenderia fasciculata]EGG17591.1 hypothetical protein DFA_08587 [Cavenderia fasciculata]|eukprot:XP_004356075.1 hypothetical protein DFA_08587 [Cavenderia fasciculata]
MYFAFGWPKTYNSGVGELFVDVSHNGDCSLLAMIGHSSLSIWSADQHRVQLGWCSRSEDSLQKFGYNSKLCWCPDSTSIAIITSEGFILVYILEKEAQDILGMKFIKDHHSSQLSHDKRKVSIKFSSSFKPSHHGAQCITGNVEYIYIFTKEGYLVKSSWTGELISQFSLDVVPFSSGVLSDQQQQQLVGTKSPLVVTSVFYSPLAPMFGLVFEDGSSAILKKRSKDRLRGYWLARENSVSVTINYKHRLAAVGLKDGNVLIYKLPGPTVLKQQQQQQQQQNGIIDEGMECKYLRTFSIFQFRDVTSDDIGPISVMKWTEDNNCLAVGWKKRGLCLWSVHGCKLTCTIPQMHENSFSEPCKEGVLSLVLSTKTKEKSWGTEGYHMILLSSGNEVGEFLQLTFVKSSSSSNPNLNHSERIILQTEDRLMFLNYKGKELGDIRWKHLQLPAAYLNDNWPIKHLAISRDRSQYAVAGRRGIILYNSLSKRWKMFGDRQQDQAIEAISLAWYKHAIAVINLHPQTQQYELLFYPKQHLDSSSLLFKGSLPSKTGAPLLIDCNDSHLALMTTDSSLYVYKVTENIEGTSSNMRSPNITLSIHLVHHLSMAVPAPPLSLSLLPSSNSVIPHILVLHYSGRLDFNHGDNGAQFTLGEGIESFWMSNIWPQLGDAGGTTLWVYGNQGIGVWFPFGAPSTNALDAPPPASSLRFDSEVYPVGCVAELGVIAGLAQGISYSSCSQYPNYELRIKTHPFLHSILKHLLTTKGGADMAWNLSSKFSTIPHFTHSLELLLHEIMSDCDHKLLAKGNNSTASKMQHAVNFLRRFPQFPEVVMRCARKIDASLWKTLFLYVGDPVQLYTKCFASGKFEIAASYLKILLSLISVEHSRKCAIDLLEIALDFDHMELAGDLVRFLDPEEDYEDEDEMEEKDKKVKGGEEEEEEEEKNDQNRTFRKPRYDGSAERKQMECILSTYASKLLKSKLLRNFLLFSKRVGVPISTWLHLEKKSTILRTTEDLDMALNSIHVQFYITLPYQPIQPFSPQSVLLAFNSPNPNEESDQQPVQTTEPTNDNDNNDKESTTKGEKQDHQESSSSTTESIKDDGDEGAENHHPSVASPLHESLSRDEMIESLKSRIQVTNSPNDPHHHHHHHQTIRTTSSSSFVSVGSVAGGLSGINLLSNTNHASLVKSISTETIELDISSTTTTSSEAIYSFKSHQFMIAPSTSNIDSNNPFFLQDSIDSSMEDLYYLLQELTNAECYEWVLVIATVLLNTTLISKALKKLPNIYENYSKMLSYQKQQGYSQLLKFVEDTIHPLLINIQKQNER